MSFYKFKRKTKLNKSKSLTVRLTNNEFDDLVVLKNKLKFDSTRELILFNMDIIQNIVKWNSLGYKFFIGNPSKKDFKEIEFELAPEYKALKQKGGVDADS